ncbi:hypothetical protein ISS22_15370 [candidate division KSB1 bacterium]|nr:hypothetical protein [candidate division KSB1 bacterium]
MKRKIIFLILVAVIFLITAPILAQKQTTYQEKVRMYEQPSLSKITAAEDRAAGHLNMGKMRAHHYNWGPVSDYSFGTMYPNINGTFRTHFWRLWFSVAMAPGPYTPQEALDSDSRGYQLIGDHTWTDAHSDWEATDGSRGNLFSDPPFMSYTYPTVVTSNIPASYPTSGDYAGKYPFDDIKGDVETYWEFSDKYGDRATNTGNYTVDGEEGKPFFHVSTKAMGYAAPDVDDIVFFDLRIANVSGYTLDSLWLGNHGDCGGPVTEGGEDYYHIGYWNMDFDRQLFWMESVYDGNVAGDGEPFGYVGLLVLRSPMGDFKANERPEGQDSICVTDFHEGEFDHRPTTMELDHFAVATTRPDLATDEIRTHWLEDKGDGRIDDPALARTKAEGGWDTFLYMFCGPFSMEPNDTVKYTFAIVGGVSEEDLLTNADMAKFMYVEKDFSGPKAPELPTVYRAVGHVAGQGGEVYNSLKHGYPINYTGTDSVVLYWSEDPEQSIDPITGVDDFEGYKIYKSTDRGRTWGLERTNEKGERIGWVPIETFDLDNDIKDRDPLGVNNIDLGSNSGLQHLWVDNDVYPGVEYWYALTVYDGGFGTGGKGEGHVAPSLESAIGNDPSAINVLAVVPGHKPLGFVDPSYGVIPQAGELANTGEIEVDIIDWARVEDKTYLLSFNAADNSYNLFDEQEETFALENETSDGSWTPIFNEIKVRVLYDASSGPLPDSTLWIKADGAPSTCNWDVAFTFTGAPSISTYEIRFTDEGDEVALFPAGMKVPFQLWNLGTNEKAEIALVMQASTDSTDEMKNSWTSGDEIKVKEIVEGTSKFTVTLTLTEPAESAINPVSGDVYQMVMAKPFTAGRDFYQIKINQKSLTSSDQMEEDEYDAIKVVPNPYMIEAPWDRSANSVKIQFTHVPDKCTISIYSVAGDLVGTIHHDDRWNSDAIGVAEWNLWSFERTEIAYGLYIYVVKVDGEAKKVGKFAIVR